MADGHERWAAPPPPPDDPRLADAIARTAAALTGDGRLALAGPAGSGRRTVALRVAADAAARWPGGAWLVPALATRLPRVLAGLAAAAGVTAPPRTSPAGLRAVWHGAARRPGLLIVDARLGADAPVIAALDVPAGWTRLLLVGAAGERRDRTILLPPGPRPPPLPDELAAVASALALADPWIGLGLDDLGFVVGAPLGERVEALIEARAALRLGADRIAPPVHDALHGVTRAAADPIVRFVERMRRHAGDRDAREREHDNLIAALGVLRRAGAAGTAAAAGFLPAAEGWIGDPASRPAAAFVVDAAAAAGAPLAEVNRLRVLLERA